MRTQKGILKTTAFTVIAAFVASIILGCGMGQNSSSVQAPAPTVVSTLTVKSTDTGVEFVSENGQTLTNEEMSTLIASISDPESNQAIELVVGSESDSRFQVGKYRIMFRFDTDHYVSCAKRNIRHLQFHIKNTQNNVDVINLGATGWRDNGPQFALWNEGAGSKFCFNSTGKFTAIRDQFMKALAVVGITGIVAYIIADAMAGVTVAAFAL